MIGRRAVAMLAAAGLALALAGAAHAQGSPPLQSQPVWRGEYFNNTGLQGSPVLVRDDPALDFSWGYGSPLPGLVNSDHFSVRWTRALDVAPGRYRVTVRSDDGYRVWLDGQLLVDRWFPQTATPFGFEVKIGPGLHQVVVEYFEQTENAEFHGAVEPAQPIEPVSGSFLGEYFANPGLTAPAAVTRPDAGIQFDWGAGSPFPGVLPADRFSVRWTGTVGGAPGMYRFTTTTDDGVRLWVNNQLLIDRWYPQAATPHSGDIYLPGPVSLRMDYFEDVGNAVAKLSWFPLSAPGGPTGTVPGGAAGAVIVDFGSPGYQQGGDGAGWNSAPGGFQGIRWALNRAQESPGFQWARWYPALAPGSYEVAVFIPGQHATTRSATYWVAHGGQFTSRVVNQAAISNAWVSLGTYAFLGDGAEYVSLNVVTGEPEASTQVGFDAVRFTRR